MSVSSKITGVITDIFPIEHLSQKFSKRIVWLKESGNEKYQEDFQIEFQNDKVTLLDNFKAGEEVSIDVNIRGRKWSKDGSKWVVFTSLVGWKISASKDVIKVPLGNIPQELTEPLTDLPF